MFEIIQDKSYKSEIIDINENDGFQFCLKPGISFILFISQTPCKYLF